MAPEDMATPEIPRFPDDLRLDCEEWMQRFADASGADGITIWLAKDGYLHAMVNPKEPDIIGTRQRADRGLISRVYLTGQPILEEDLPSQPGHDPGVDRLLGRRCLAMMAAPLEDGADGGVLSAVVFGGSSPPRRFSRQHFEDFIVLADNIGRRLEESL